MKYQVVCEDDLQEFACAVEILLSDGWVCQGGMSVTAVRIDRMDQTFYWYYQAMVKDG